MDERIVRVALKPQLRIIVLHPAVKRIVQEQIGQQRTYHSALRRTFTPRLFAPIRPRLGGPQPTRYIEPDPGIVVVHRHCPFDQFMVHTVKDGFDVKIDYPIKLKAALTRPRYRTQRGAVGPIAVKSRLLRRFDFGEQAASLAIGTRRTARR
jgi:hypothetical protein